MPVRMTLRSTARTLCATAALIVAVTPFAGARAGAQGSQSRDYLAAVGAKLAAVHPPAGSAQRLLALSGATGGVMRRSRPNGVSVSNSMSRSSSIRVLARDTAAVANAPRATLTPPNLVVAFFGDNFDENKRSCNFVLSARGDVPQGAPGANHNDCVDGAYVPFNMRIKVCEHNGVGSAGWGECHSWGVGRHYFGDDFRDKGTSFWVWDDGTSLFLSTASDEMPSALNVKIVVKVDDKGNVSLKELGSLRPVNRDWYEKHYEFELPSWCPTVDVWESTKANDAMWSHNLQGNRLTIDMRVKRRLPFSSNNWVGVGIRCKS